jgi:SHS2 domain-containing protein
MKPIYKYFDHTADLGIEVYGKILEELFINIGKAIFETQISGKIALKKEIKIEFESESIDDLFIDWCRELLYNFSVHGFIPKKYEISIDNLSLKAHLYGDVFNNKKYKIKTEIKNPTYHNFQLNKTPECYKATIIFDV